MDEKEPRQTAQLAVRIDRERLKELVQTIRIREGDNEWCVACGAGAASAKLDFPEEIVKQAGAQLLDVKALRELASSMKDLGEQAWCVACGAGAKAGPETRINPADVSDAFIDEVAQKLLGAVRVGP